MYRQLGLMIGRWWMIVLIGWFGGFVVLRLVAPPFDDQAKGGEFVFLPDHMASRQAEFLLNRAFSGRQTTSNVVIVVHRDDDHGLTDDDRSFIDDKLRPVVEQIRDKVNPSATTEGNQKKKPTIVAEIHSSSDQGIGQLLVSSDGKSSLVTMDLETDFQDSRNWTVIRQVEETLNDFNQGQDKPQGLQLALTGSAVLGRDISSAERASAQNTRALTIGMVVVLLVIIYRAPLLALVPLITLYLAVDVSLRLLTLLAERGYVPLFKGLEVYTTVITYGPGIDYCLFLIARYKENLQACVPPRESLQNSISQVGAAIVASAATVICGIGMLSFAQFGKFHEAGISISIALVITLIATMTLAPALLRMTGRWAFWPKSAIPCDDPNQPARPDEAMVQRNMFQPMWDYMGHVIERRPLGTLVLTTLCLVPFSIVGIATYRSVSYGLLESLPKTAPSVTGAQLLEQGFPAGITGPVDILISNKSLDFRGQEGFEFIHNLTNKLMKRKDELKIADIRSVASPLGMSIRPAQAPAEDAERESVFQRTVSKRTTTRRSVEHYVSGAPDLAGQVTELEVILNANPFSIDSVNDLKLLSSAIEAELPAEQRDKTSFTFVGPTASVSDVNLISQSDQQRIYVLVVSCVLAILVVLLRTVSVSIYLILTVLLSYLATLGVTWLVFYLMDPKTFIGLDWTVPLFLFVVLIAVGEDYNIFLVTRIHEEQAERGAKQGITSALSKTGGIITSCGFIMAGTFASLCAGSLVRMQQLGFALAFGVLLDTFVIRPILVPAFLMLLNDERFGKLIRYAK